MSNCQYSSYHKMVRDSNKNAIFMYYFGGSNDWGNRVRGDLVKFYKLGVEPEIVHRIAYDVADERATFSGVVLGRGEAYGAAFFWKYINGGWYGVLTNWETKYFEK